MTAVAAPAAVVLRVEPRLAEEAVLRSLAAPGRVAELAAHRRRAEDAYAIEDPRERDTAFGRLALAEFGTLDLGRPLLRALGERPRLAERVEVVIVGAARGRHDEGVTCEPGGRHLGMRLEAGRFGEAEALLAWARHGLLHAEDTLDPDFAFDTEWQAIGGGSLRAPTQARLHRLWDISVDGRLAREHRLDADAAADARAGHESAVAGDLAAVEAGVAEAVVERLWTGSRPTFPELRAWAEQPATLVRLVAPWASGLPRPDRCPLCRFPSQDVIAVEPALARVVVAEHPGWRPESGLCGRCADRYRLAGLLGGHR
jgi:hypothetical protein